TILSAQCTDARVNQVTPSVFERWPGPIELANAEQAGLEEVIHAVGFYHNKAKNLIACAQRIKNDFGGCVPKTLAELVTLPGVARKTANVVLWGAFHINEGLAVDTHVKRIAYRLGLSDEKEPNRVEQDLMLLFPKEEWGNINHKMVWFGRDVCMARTPKCSVCVLTKCCAKRLS
ncbi:MAG: endonuclease III, partial [Desulfovibrio sp.]|nr:endonuclease III [Desulfovibrio sp.]